MRSALALLLLAKSAEAADGPRERLERGSGSPTLEAIEGDKIVVVITADGNRVAGVGAELEFGNRVKTGPRASAKIKFPDGSKLLVGRASEVEVQESKEGVQFNTLLSGEVRGVIRRPRGLQKAPASGPPRFVIRSKAVVMGVRGTDFVFNLDESTNKSSVHTLQGLVEVSKDEPTLMEGKGTPVPERQYVDADQQSIAPPRAFDRDRYAESLMAQQPEFVALVRGDREILEHNSGADPMLKRPERKRLSLLSFELNELVIKQKSGGLLSTGELAWSPRLDLFLSLYVRGHLSGFPLRGRDKETRFFGAHAGVSVGTQLLKPLLLEAGLGVQAWTKGYSDPGPAVTLMASYLISDTGSFERLFVAMTHYEPTVHHTDDSGSFQGNNNSDQFKIGVGFQF